MVGFVASSVGKGLEVLDQQEVVLPALGSAASLKLVKTRSGKREHIAVFALDALTLAMVTATERTEELSTEDFTAMLRTFRVETPSTAVAPTADPEDGAAMVRKVQRAMGERTGVSAEEARQRPTSTVAGKPSVANSCQISPRDCYETPHSMVGKGYYSNAKACLGTFEDGICPAVNRRAYCVLPNKQLIHMYGDADFDLEANKRRCTGTYSGRWLGLPSERPWPVN